MLHACYLLTGAQAEGRREGPRPVGIEAVQLHRRVGEIACAHAARDGPRGRTPGAGPGGYRGVERETAPPVGTTRRAVHGGATGGGDPRVRLTGCGPRAAAVDAVTPGCIARGVLMDVLQLSKSGQRTLGRVDRAPSHAATSNSFELNLLPNIRTVQAPRLPLPDHVHGLVSLDRSPRRVEFTKALLGRHASFDRAPSCAGSPAGRWSPRR